MMSLHSSSNVLLAQANGGKLQGQGVEEKDIWEMQKVGEGTTYKCHIPEPQAPWKVPGGSQRHSSPGGCLGFLPKVGLGPLSSSGLVQLFHQSTFDYIKYWDNKEIGKAIPFQEPKQTQGTI